MAVKRMNLYHITKYETAIRILDGDGIDPKFSQGKRQVMWYVGKNLIPWAIAHVAQRHNLTIDQIAILYTTAPTTALLRSSRNNVYCTTHILRPIEMDSAVIWLQRQESRVFIRNKMVRGSGFVGRNHNEEDELS